jgi:hypothetical protein
MMECLSDEFCVIFDDYEREGEKHTVEGFCAILKEKGVEHTTNVFKGEKEHIAICTSKFKFITVV